MYNAVILANLTHKSTCLSVTKKHIYIVMYIYMPTPWVWAI